MNKTDVYQYLLGYKSSFHYTLIIYSLHCGLYIVISYNKNDILSFTKRNKSQHARPPCDPDSNCIT